MNIRKYEDIIPRFVALKNFSASLTFPGNQFGEVDV